MKKAKCSLLDYHPIKYLETPLIQKLRGAIERVYFNRVSVLSRLSSRETSCLELGYPVDRDLSSG